jgi:hypothetical protein
MWIKINHFNTDPKQIINSLVINIEDVVKFKDAVANILLKQIGDKRKPETDFQSFINGIFQYAHFSNKDSTHIYNSEYEISSK